MTIYRPTWCFLNCNRWWWLLAGVDAQNSRITPRTQSSTRGAAKKLPANYNDTGVVDPSKSLTSLLSANISVIRAFTVTLSPNSLYTIRFKYTATFFSSTLIVLWHRSRRVVIVLVAAVNYRFYRDSLFLSVCRSVVESSWSRVVESSLICTRIAVYWQWNKSITLNCHTWVVGGF